MSDKERKPKLVRNARRWLAARWAQLSGAGGGGKSRGSDAPPLRDGAAAGVLLVLALVGVWFGGRALRYHLVVAKLLGGGPISEPPPGLALDLAQHASDEMLLRRIVDECAKRQDTVLQVTGAGANRSLVVALAIDHTQCPILDVMLRGAERGVGMCTDVALYALYAGARIIPMPSGPEALAAYDRACGRRTARLFLESMYGEFVSRQAGVLHVQLLNSEHLWSNDAAVHARMQLFLCKTRFCLRLMRQHVADRRYWASVWHMGHTSSDPSVGMTGDVAAGLRASLGHGQAGASYAIHVKGKSGLKQTRAVLDCWARHPEWPTLVVVGRASDEEATPAARHAGNIVFYPPLSGGAEQQLIDAARVRELQAAAALHVCPSVREGFGLYLNEARAVGALTVTVDHPPMNELVTNATGVLVPPSFTKSEPGTELGRLAHLNGHVTADALCGAVAAGLALPPAEAAGKRAALRAAYRADKAAFLARMQQLRAFLAARAQAGAEKLGAAAAAPPPAAAAAA